MLSSDKWLSCFLKIIHQNLFIQKKGILRWMLFWAALVHRQSLFLFFSVPKAILIQLFNLMAFVNLLNAKIVDIAPVPHQRYITPVPKSSSPIGDMLSMYKPCIVWCNICQSDFSVEISLTKKVVKCLEHHLYGTYI